ncbi:cytosine-purine permease [Niveomyces insectorum RCEF 264]|uniref:Cytosine-purine permease n=1 Tax=Niveomyces insectorum RCEF 264 TaxID=1081102 RepID=A0A167NB93_9HYPO|nr:cytosine-purine permease [Niveomyces insectorum RCEF 264]
MSSSDREEPFGNDVEKQTPFERQIPTEEAEGERRGNGKSSGFASRGFNFKSLLFSDTGDVYNPHPEKNAKWYQRLLDAGFEENGVKPVPIDKRTNTQYSNLFTIFFTSMLSLLPIPTGVLATLTFGLSLRDASLVILFFALLTSIPPAYLGVGGSQTGMRQQIQARYSFGRYLVTIVVLLNAATVTGFTLISAVVSGQTISALNPDHVSVKVGIVIICLVSFLVSLLGYRTLHFVERWTWIPNIISLVVAVGCGGKYLHLQSPTEPATASAVLSYGGIIAGYFLTFSGTASDYSTYHNPSVSKFKLFACMYSGILLPSIPLLILGAAIGGAVPNVESWNTAYDVSGVGGVVYEMLTPAKGFGKFLVVLLALSGMGNIAISTYSVALNLQMLLPIFARIHRIIFIFITLAIMIPFAIKAAEKWEESLNNFLAIIGYWAGCFAAVLLEELVVFRRRDFSTYDITIWDDGRKLPPGIAAMGASILSFGLIVPGMAEVWYTGPIAETTGDIGFEVAFALTFLLYLPLRWLEIKWRGGL